MLNFQTPHPSDNPQGYISEEDIQSWNQTDQSERYSPDDDLPLPPALPNMPVGQGDWNQQREGNDVGYDTASQGLQKYQELRQVFNLQLSDIIQHGI